MMMGGKMNDDILDIEPTHFDESNIDNGLGAYTVDWREKGAVTGIKN